MHFSRRKSHLLEESIWGENLGEVRNILFSGHRSRVWFPLFFWLAQPVRSWTHHFNTPLFLKMCLFPTGYLCLIISPLCPAWLIIFWTPIATPSNMDSEGSLRNLRLHVQALNTQQFGDFYSGIPGRINSREITGPYTMVLWILCTL